MLRTGGGVIANDKVLETLSVNPSTDNLKHTSSSGIRDISGI